MLGINCKTSNLQNQQRTNMNLVKSKWSSADVKDFLDYLYSLSRGEEKASWEKRIVNTNMKCLAVQSADVANIVKEIKKGDSISFIDTFLPVWDNHTLINILGKLICTIKDFDMFKKYLKVYAQKIDNWSSCDTLKFNIKGREKDYLQLSKEFQTSPYPFVRRIGLGILFNQKVFVDEVFVALDRLQNEQEYYVNMMGAWCLQQCMVIARDKTLQYFKNNQTNKFIINKAISKCRDSFQISKEDKGYLLQFRK